MLLVQRGQEPLKGEWSLPGGVVEIGETLEAALAREVREETSLDVVVGPVVEVLDSIRRDCGRARRIPLHHRRLCCAASAAARRSRPSRGTDADDVRWVAVADLERYGVTATAIAVIRKAAV